MTKLTIEDVARIAYDANRRLNIVAGNVDYPTWDDVAPEDRLMFLEGVRGQWANPNRSAKQVHDYWMDDRIANGWKYGETRDFHLKTHPSLIPFEEISVLEQVKDTLFTNMVAALMPLTSSKPQFVTFTGVDAKTDIDRLLALSKKYPIEWGMLIGGNLSPNRYPNQAVRTLIMTMWHDAKFSLHLCGEYAQSALHAFSEDAGLSELRWAKDTLALDISIRPIFNRVQINAGKYNIENLSKFQKAINKPVIMQSRGKEFGKPLDGVHKLFDTSGGKGRTPGFWPIQDAHAGMIGYAGGIGPDNVVQVLSEINAHTFWIDMESKIRDENDWLDLDKCETVCKAIWG